MIRVPMFQILLALIFHLLVALGAYAQTGDGNSQGTIIPFHSVNGFMPGLAKYSDVAQRYGAPEEIEIPKRRVVVGIELGGNRIIHYRSKGLSFLLSEGADAIIEAIFVESPYVGRTANGLFLGMREPVALSIIRREYHVGIDLGGSLLIAKTAKHENTFQVWFERGVLVRMKLFAS